MAKGKKMVLKCAVVRAKVLGVKVYRGFANLSELAEVSKADIYDRQKNPKGTQRDLSPAHARDAYEYVKGRELGFWPEVFLCARKRDVMTFYPVSADLFNLGVLEIDAKAAREDPDLVQQLPAHRVQLG